jgi:hypothetical protein
MAPMKVLSAYLEGVLLEHRWRGTSDGPSGGIPGEWGLEAGGVPRSRALTVRNSGTEE